MRLSVALLRNVDAETKAKEKAEAPTVKTKEQIEREEELKAKYGTTAKEAHQAHHNAKEPQSRSIWKRRFRPLPEAKAVDLFADVIGDGFILAVAVVLIIYEYQRSSQKPDTNLEMIKALDERFEELKKRENELEEVEKRHLDRLQAIEDALRAYRDPKTKQPLLPTPLPTPAA